MDNFINELNELFEETIYKINKIEDKYDDIAVSYISNIYKNILRSSLDLNEEKDIFDKFKNIEYGKVSSFLVSDNPTIIQTKSGKKIVLSEDPISIKTSTGKKIVLDHDPITRKKSKRIVLDHDPIAHNNISIIESKIKDLYTPSPWSGYDETIAFVSDENPTIVELPKGKKIVLSEDPISYKTKTGKKIVLDHDPIQNPNALKRIVLKEDPISIQTKSGKKIVLDHDPEIDFSKLKREFKF